MAMFVEVHGERGAFVFANVRTVKIKPFSETVLCLSHILGSVAFSARNEVYYVSTITGEVISELELFLCLT